MNNDLYHVPLTLLEVKKLLWWLVDLDLMDQEKDLYLHLYELFFRMRDREK